MNVVDSSGWIEYLTSAPNAAFFAPAILDTPQLVVPSISIYEVAKVLLRDDDDLALLKVAQMSSGQVVPLDRDLSITAARLSLELSLPMADSIILATAQAYEATLWTQDVDFEEVKGVRYIEKG